MLSNSHLQDFIWEHRLDDPQRLALAGKKYPHVPIAYVAGQVDFLQKIQKKVPSWYRKGLQFPAAVSMEQASSEATARFKSGLVRGKKMADLTGGLGIDCAFLGRSFEEVVYVEMNRALLETTRHNYGVLGIEHTAFVHASAEDFLGATPDSFDLIYLDPSRRNDRKGKVFMLQDCSPNILEIKALALEKAPRILLKTAPLLDIHLTLKQLGCVSQVWVVSWNDECREVLYLLERTLTIPEQALVHAIDIGKDEKVLDFQFNYANEHQANVEFALPQAFLYEPNTAVLKAGAFRSFGQKLGLKKLHPHTHLYTSAVYVPEVPGRSFVIEAVCKYDRKSIAMHVADGKANISTRNFPDNAEQVRKKLGLADGGSTYIFAFTDWEDRKMLAVCRKV